MRIAGVLFAGIVTTFFTLLLVLSLKDTVNLLGFYFYYFLPVGAVLVGVLAALGYTTVARLTRTPISGSVMILIFLIHLSAYFLMDYLLFSSMKLVHVRDESPVGYWEYFDIVTRSISRRSSFTQTTGRSFGIFGYLFRALEIGGYLFALFAIDVKDKSSEVCQKCRRTYDEKIIAALPADPENIEKTQLVLDQLHDVLESGDTEALIELLGQSRLPESEAKERLDVVRVRLRWCPGCFEGTFLVRPVGVDVETLIDEPLPPDQMAPLTTVLWS
jgi:hypothetical protein